MQFGGARAILIPEGRANPGQNCSHPAQFWFANRLGRARKPDHLQGWDRRHRMWFPENLWKCS